MGNKSSSPSPFVSSSTTPPKLTRQASSPHLLPHYWTRTPCAGSATFHDVPQGSKEFDIVATAFYASLRGTRPGILTVQRIENLDLWHTYVAKRHALVGRSAAEGTKRDIERIWLFHGSSATTVRAICQQGFNRSFNGKNATAYGKGVYFARDATYSMGRAYSQPDKQGVQTLILARVCVGIYCAGRSSQLIPDVRDSATQLLYDSTVDSLSNPSIYVTYHDAQAYPEYIVRFKPGAPVPSFAVTPPETRCQTAAETKREQDKAAALAAALAAARAIKLAQASLTELCTSLYACTWTDAECYAEQLRTRLHPQSSSSASSEAELVVARATLAHCTEIGLGLTMDLELSKVLYRQVDLDLLDEVVRGQGAGVSQQEGEEVLPSYGQALLVPLAQFHLGRMLDVGRGAALHRGVELGPLRVSSSTLSALSVTTIALILACWFAPLPSSLAFLGTAWVVGFLVLALCLVLVVPAWVKAQEAVGWYRQSAEAGNSYAQLNLGLCYYLSKGVYSDREEGIALVQKAALTRTNTHAVYVLGHMFRSRLTKGTSRSKSKEKVDAASMEGLGRRGTEYYRVAAESGHPDAQYKLACCYVKGSGVKRDQRAARLWFERSAKRGHAGAREMLARMGSQSLWKGATVLLKAHSRKYSKLTQCA